MSTYAAIFLMDPKTEKFNGLTVKYDGYVEGGVGENLYNNWINHDKVLQLINDGRTDIRELGKNLEETDFFIDERPNRKNHFRNLSYDQMISEGGNVDYLYVMVPDDLHGWDWKVQLIDGFHRLEDFFD